MAEVDPKINPPAPTDGPPKTDPPKTDPPPADKPPADSGKKDADDKGKSGDDDTATRLKAMEENLRNTGAERDNLKSILEKLGKVLNPEKETDPAELAKSLSAKDQELADTKLELAVLKVAGSERGADLLDSRKFMASIKGLDPASEAFTAKVKEMMGDDKSGDKREKKGKSAGAEMTGGNTGTKSQLTRADLKNMSPEEIEKAESEGRLTALLSGQGA
jgi:hypothetical protein